MSILYIIAIIYFVARYGNQFKLQNEIIKQLKADTLQHREVLKEVLAELQLIGIIINISIPLLYFLLKLMSKSVEQTNVEINYLFENLFGFLLIIFLILIFLNIKSYKNYKKIKNLLN